MSTQSLSLSSTVGHAHTEHDWNRPARFVRTLSAVHIAVVPSGSQTENARQSFFKIFGATPQRQLSNMTCACMVAATCSHGIASHGSVVLHVACVLACIHACMLISGLGYGSPAQGATGLYMSVVKVRILFTCFMSCVHWYIYVPDHK